MKNIFEILYEQIISEAWQHFDPRKRTGSDKGTVNETVFDKVMSDNGFIVKTGSDFDDRVNHIDRRLYYKKKTNKGELVKAWSDLPENANCLKNCNTVEVKGPKVDGNGDFWIETIGVHANHEGWLYTKANYISVEYQNKMWFMKSRKLKEQIERLGGFKLVINNGKYQVKMNDGSQPKIVFNKSQIGFPIFYDRNDGSHMITFPMAKIIEDQGPMMLSYPMMGH